MKKRCTAKTGGMDDGRLLSHTHPVSVFFKMLVSDNALRGSVQFAQWFRWRRIPWRPRAPHGGNGGNHDCANQAFTAQMATSYKTTSILGPRVSSGLRFSASSATHVAGYYSYCQSCEINQSTQVAPRFGQVASV